MELKQGQGQTQKHLVLFDSMNGHRSVLSRLSELADRIEGGAIEPSDGKEVQSNPSLKEFLLNAPEQMGIMTDILSAQIAKIEANLF